ncbi:hypothetical protein BDP81DRAFT_410415 [Colletotrichum phormii]|uniref:Uncharacterized protein n=1 Tax=Colletotrichum phormii TaxID=359342 RepID=A0AAI9ZFZ8_9PEZI|nr:uncharacterized protein BDP81DRAFT_410415 [Colletotrichum phormii]KAK1623741.1 hypothetical protein BDP81DRAFT_410415 [Colletotrichum phormii]
MRAATLIAACFAASAAAQTIYCCVSNDQDQVVPMDDQTERCCQASEGNMQGQHECALEVGLFGFSQCCRQQSTSTCNF